MPTKQCRKCKLIKPTSGFNKSRSRSEKTRCYCKDCERADAREYYRRNPESYKKRAREFKKKKSAEFLQEANAIKERTGCCLCGEKTLCCLDFHHLVGNSKGREGGMPVSRAACNSEKQFRRELKKCVVLCANCHRKVHAGILHIRKGAKQ
jgi:hypothetical protein